MGKRFIIIISILLICAVNIFAQGGKAEPRRIEIPKGKTIVNITGSLKKDWVADYVFTAKKGQFVTVRILSIKPRGRFQGFIVRGDEIDFQSEMERLEVEKFIAPETGDYFIFVEFKPERNFQQGSY